MSSKRAIDTLEAECAALRERLGLLETQLKELQARDPSALAAAPVRSVRRASARRASTRRAAARTRKLDVKVSIVEFLSEHPGSTAGEVAKGLDLERESVSSRLTQLAKLGQIRKVERGYAAR